MKNYTPPQALLAKCAQPEKVAALIIALKRAVKGPDEALDGGACNRLLIQTLTGFSPEQMESFPPPPVQLICHNTGFGL